MEKMRVEIQIPEDIIKELLIRLPVKSLMRFKCVSKSWSSLISSKEFVKIHLKFTTKTHKDNFLEHNCTYCSDRFLLSSSLNTTRRVSVLGSCNGLCCIKHGHQFLLWNPATTEYKRLPDLLGVREARLGMDSFGFGYDEFHDDYKLVVGYYNEISHLSTPYLYSLRTNSWTEIEHIHGFVFDVCGKFVNGRLHWSGYFGEIREKSRRFLTFDLGTEVCGFVEQPMQTRYGCVSTHVIDGCLSMACRGEPMIGGLNVWVMKQYGLMDSWCLVASFCCSFTNNPVLSDISLLRNPLHLLPNGEILCYYKYKSKLITYSTKHKSYKFLPIKCDGLCLKDGVGAIIQSLVSPKLTSEL